VRSDLRIGADRASAAARFQRAKFPGKIKHMPGMMELEKTSPSLLNPSKTALTSLFCKKVKYSQSG
jgi:hypothetical protein